jgi:hypothetical protein
MRFARCEHCAYPERVLIMQTVRRYHSSKTVKCKTFSNVFFKLRIIVLLAVAVWISLDEKLTVLRESFSLVSWKKVETTVNFCAVKGVSWPTAG